MCNKFHKVSFDEGFVTGPWSLSEPIHYWLVDIPACVCVCERSERVTVGVYMSNL